MSSRNSATREKHVRECFIVLEDDADADTVRNSIVTMPDYFEPFDTTVHLLMKRHSPPNTMPCPTVVL